MPLKFKPCQSNKTFQNTFILFTKHNRGVGHLTTSNRSVLIRLLWGNNRSYHTSGSYHCNILYKTHISLNSPLPEQNGCHSGRRHFQMYFLECKLWSSDSNLIEICSYESNWQWTSIGSGNGLAPNRRQAITWTIAVPDHWHIYAVLGEDELNKSFMKATWNISVIIRISQKQHTNNHSIKWYG